RAVVEEITPFTRMLRIRGDRFITVALGNSDSERSWKLTGFAEAIGVGPQRHRALGDGPALATYQGVFFAHFDYGWMVLRLAAPRSLAGVRLVLSGTVLSVPAELLAASPRMLWQIPLPPGLILSKHALEISIEAPGWPLCDIAVTGDAIRDVHLEGLGLKSS